MLAQGTGAHLGTVVHESHLRALRAIPLALLLACRRPRQGLAVRCLELCGLLLGPVRHLGRARARARVRARVRARARARVRLRVRVRV